MYEREIELDEVGPWSEVKLEIIEKYVAAYSTVLAKQPDLKHIYVDAFAGAGVVRSRETGEIIRGSPLLAQSVVPRFHEYHFIDLNPDRVDSLQKQMQAYPDTYVHPGDCNAVLMDEILPRCRWKDFRRALWLLDPYGLHYRWPVVEAAGRERSIELLLNFPIMDINRTVGLRKAAEISENAKARMTAFWGDESWERVVHNVEDSLFTEYPHKAEGDRIVGAYCDRLKTVAGFRYVPEPLLFTVPASNAPLYYIVFASNNQTGGRIAGQILKRYRRKGAG